MRQSIYRLQLHKIQIKNIGLTLLLIAVQIFNHYCWVDDDVHKIMDFACYADQKAELWRLLTYSLIHGSSAHLFSNVAILLILGPTIEALHGKPALFAMSFGGVVMGATFHMFRNKNIGVIGSSAGVYSLLAVSLWNVILNANSMTSVLPKVILLIGLALPGFVSWTDSMGDSGITSVAHSAHIGGFICGTFIAMLPSPIGVNVLTPTSVKPPLRAMVAFICFVVIFTISTITFVG